MEDKKGKQSEIFGKLLTQISDESDLVKRFKLIEQLELFARALATMPENIRGK